MRTFAFVFARGGSKGIPRKNILPLCGKPLLVHAIDMAASLPEVESCFVSTDDPEIAEVSSANGAQVIQRPVELATDSSPEWLSWQHAVQWVRREVGEFDRFLSLPTTSPLRAREDVLRCLDGLDSEADISLCITASNRNPWFNMVSINNQGYVELMNTPDGEIHRRQAAPQAFDIATVAYVTRPDFILNSTGLWGGRVRGVEVPPGRAIDIDTPLDFKIAEFLMRDG